MMCFKIFKDKSKSKRAVSAPELGRSSRKFGASNLRPASTSLPSPKTIPELYKEKEHNLRVFTYQELSDATCAFNRSLRIGEGGFGTVYRGKLNLTSGRPRTVDVAIKKLNKNGRQGHKEWMAEVLFLGVVNHPNLVRLLGYCNEDDERGIQRLLVYEYMPNRSFEDHLFGRQFPTLTWAQRLDIIHGAAEGLAYLHGGMETQVIYRDFKSSNILIDKDFKPKLSDFGLAREGPRGDQTHVSTMPVGTYGYAAPEYVETGHLKAESDIWSFGVVLYELLTGRRALETNRPLKEQRLLLWIKEFPVDSKKFCMIMDPRLRNEYSLNAAKTVAKLADSCLNKNPKDRPSMSQVVEILQQAIQECTSVAAPSKSI